MNAVADGTWLVSSRFTIDRLKIHARTRSKVAVGGVGEPASCGAVGSLT
jgi:hypothetical protein